MAGIGKRAPKRIGRPRKVEVEAEATAVQFLQAHSREYAERLHKLADAMWKKWQREVRKGGEWQYPTVLFNTYRQLHEAASGKPVEQHLVQSQSQRRLEIVIKGWTPGTFGPPQAASLPAGLGNIVEGAIRSEIAEAVNEQDNRVGEQDTSSV